MILVWDELGIEDFDDAEYASIAHLLVTHTVMWLPDEVGAE